MRSTPDDYADALAEAEEAGTPYGLFVYDGFVPDEPRRFRRCSSGPGRWPFGTVGAVINGPALDRTDPGEPLLRYVDLSTVHIGRARAVELAEGMRTVITSVDGDPLLAAGRVNARSVALLSFSLGETDLPLQVAFPLLVSNLTDFLLPPSEWRAAAIGAARRAAVGADGPGHHAGVA